MAPFTDTGTRSWTYDVFLSFRGEDTGTNFTDHLYHALLRKGINTFIDDQLIRGEEISPALLKAIEESRISIIVFSENYASSSWCLDELVKILRCKELNHQMVWPVFYKVDPSHVRKQTGTFGASFAECECKFRDNMERVPKWREALTEAANLSGWHFKEAEYEYNFISKIVESISVHVLSCTYLHVAKYPTGLQSSVRDVNAILDVGVNRCCMVGIWGTPGIGKTTVAKAVYNSIAHKFESSCFVENVTENSMSHGGLLQLQERILRETLGGKDLNVISVDRGISVIKQRLSLKKVLLILDDVNHLDQLNKLAGAESWFGQGSRVIITTRDRGLLTRHGIELIYKVRKLDYQQALELFSLNAFEMNAPPDGYLELAERAIAYAQHLPLGLTLLGSHLRNQSMEHWRAKLDCQEGDPFESIQSILRISYDALADRVKQVFLDIACFFKGQNKDYVMQILQCKTLKNAEDCIQELVQKAIITIEDNRILMHDLLEQMGKDIVHEESPTEPGERSRLWFHEDVSHVLRENTGTNKIKGIMIKLPKPDELHLNAKSFSGMTNLCFFINHNASLYGEFGFVPNKLRLIDWGNCELQSLPSNIQLNELVVFNMPNSCIRQLGSGFKVHTLFPCVGIEFFFRKDLVLN
ncbi:disease resistance protein RPV1 [Rosa sericea]